jgi:hypothetical protein
MSSRSRITVPAKKPRSWAVTLIKNRGVFLGFVEAPDQKAAELAAAKAFTLKRVAAQAAAGAGAQLAEVPQRELIRAYRLHRNQAPIFDAVGAGWKDGSADAVGGCCTAPIEHHIAKCSLGTRKMCDEFYHSVIPFGAVFLCHV